MFHQSSYDWQYKTVPQKYSCMAMIENSSRWTSGKGWGGSQLLNNMILLNDIDNDDHDKWFNHNNDNDDDLSLLQFNDDGKKFKSIFGDNLLLAAHQFGYKNNEFFRPNFMQRSGKRYTSGNFYTDKQNIYCHHHKHHRCNNNHRTIFYATVSIL